MNDVNRLRDPSGCYRPATHYASRGQPTFPFSGRQKNPSQAALSGEQPLRDIERIRLVAFTRSS